MCSAGRGGRELALKLRIPGWAVGEGVRVEVNGEPWESCAAAGQHLAGSFCTVRRAFAAGVACHACWHEFCFSRSMWLCTGTS